MLLYVFYKIMNKIITIIILFSIKSFGQINSGTVQYNVTFIEDKELDGGNLGNYIKDAKANSKYLTYSLDFNANEMVFYKTQNLTSDDNGDTSFAEAFSGVSGKYFKKKNSNILLNEIDNKHLDHILVSKEMNLKWNLLNETKIIDNYLCYKATSIIIITNGVGVFKRNLIAWYCPKIPVPFGPKGYGGLPGLVLEFQDRNVLFGAKKISLIGFKLIF